MGQDIVGQKFVGQDVAGAISLGKEVSGAGGSGAASRESRTTLLSEQTQCPLISFSRVLVLLPCHVTDKTQFYWWSI